MGLIFQLRRDQSENDKKLPATENETGEIGVQQVEAYQPCPKRRQSFEITVEEGREGRKFRGEGPDKS